MKIYWREKGKMSVFASVGKAKTKTKKRLWLESEVLELKNIPRRGVLSDVIV